VVDLVPGPNAIAWDAESYQRNGIASGLQDAAPDDVIMVSDVDEIPKASRVRDFAAGDADEVALATDLYYYKLNCRCLTATAHEVTPMLLRARRFTTAQDARLWARRYWKYRTPVVRNSGWHFACMQDPAGLSRKLKSFSHTELSGPEFTDINKIEWRIRYGLDLANRKDMVFSAVPLDDSFPAYLRKHQSEYADMLFDVAKFHGDRQRAIIELTQHVETLRAENKQLSADIEAFKNSRSWRMTEPLRRLVRRFRPNGRRPSGPSGVH
jgi:glycosyl transferase family 17